jgi:HD superfamily phosphodiesterase
LEQHIYNWIRKAEQKWLHRLHLHVSALFAGRFLPSHDQSHHLRVWNICKYLLREIAGFNEMMDEELVEGLIIAAWFHDTGMSLSIGREHGALGRELCERFLNAQERPRPLRADELLEAIERHDLKKEQVYGEFVAGTPPGILALLSVADDLEALGLIGIYRYTEIYLNRGIPLKELGFQVLENAGKRFRNIVSSCRQCGPLVKTYHQQYNELAVFFDAYNRQLLAESDPAVVYCGHVGIVNYIRKWSVEAGVRPEHYLQELEGIEPGAIVQTYFNQLKNELERARL